jgi:hypothetical protein
MVVYVSPNYDLIKSIIMKRSVYLIDGYILRIWFVGGDYHAEWCGDVHEGMYPSIGTDFFTWIRTF